MSKGSGKKRSAPKKTEITKIRSQHLKAYRESIKKAREHLREVNATKPKDERKKLVITLE